MINKKTLSFINKSTNPNPEFAKKGDSGFDLRAWITPEEADIFVGDEEIPSIILNPLERRLIHTGLYFEMPSDTEIQVRSRSGMTLKQGLIVANTPGTIDSKYQGEVCIIIVNISDTPATISNGFKIAQGVLMPVYNEAFCELKQIEAFASTTERGDGAFGHTGIV